mmetsp:Transcript_9529/g.13709  ORF Transcript_9529/g.13709 Transcript_9529/m.13709 type:complete len:90 (+) Transcript_9529:370-639(+)
MCRQITYYPPQSYAVLVPTFLLCAFVAALFLYGAINAMIVPKVHAIENLWDEHSRVFKPTVQDGRLPDICDIDVAVVNDALEKASRRGK